MNREELDEHLRRVEAIRSEIFEHEQPSRSGYNLTDYLERARTKIAFFEHGDRDWLFMPSLRASKDFEELNEDEYAGRFSTSFKTSKRKLLAAVDRYLKGMRKGIAGLDAERSPSSATKPKARKVTTPRKARPTLPDSPLEEYTPVAVPVIIRFRSRTFPLVRHSTILPSARAKANNAILKIVETCLKIKHLNERLQRHGRSIESSSDMFVEQMSSPTNLRQSGLIDFVGGRSTLQIQTAKLFPSGTTTGNVRVTKKPSLIQVSEPYIVQSYTEHPAHITVEVAEFSRLSAFIQGKKVKFHEVTLQKGGGAGIHVTVPIPQDVEAFSEDDVPIPAPTQAL